MPVHLATAKSSLGYSRLRNTVRVLYSPFLSVEAVKYTFNTADLTQESVSRVTQTWPNQQPPKTRQQTLNVQYCSNTEPFAAMRSAIDDCHSEAYSPSLHGEKRLYLEKGYFTENTVFSQGVSKPLQIIALILLKLEDADSISLVTLKQLSPC